MPSVFARRDDRAVIVGVFDHAVQHEPCVFLVLEDFVESPHRQQLILHRRVPADLHHLRRAAVALHAVGEREARDVHAVRHDGHRRMRPDGLHVVRHPLLRHADHHPGASRQDMFDAPEQRALEVVGRRMHDVDHRHAQRQRARVKRRNGRVRKDHIRMKTPHGAEQMAQLDERPMHAAPERSTARRALSSSSCKGAKSACAGNSEATHTAMPSAH